MLRICTLRPPRVVLAFLVVGALLATGCNIIAGLDGFRGAGGTGAEGGSEGGGGTGGDATLIGNCAIDPGEACDDCNPVANDGCSDAGEVEQGWWCPEEGEPCLALSGYEFDATDEWLTVGGDGGGVFDDACPAGTALVGFDFEVGLELYALRGVCASPQVGSDGELGWSAVPIPTGVHGGGGGQIEERHCAPGEFVVGVASWETTVVAGLEVSCAALQLVGDVFQYGPVTTLPIAGDATAGATRPARCSAPSLIDEMDGRSGSRIDRLALRCRSVVPTFCGDGEVQGQEVCDDGNTVADDDCPQRCR